MGNIRIIIGWRVICNLDARMLKIDQSAYIWELIEEEGLSNYNLTNIPIKASSFIDM